MPLRQDLPGCFSVISCQKVGEKPHVVFCRPEHQKYMIGSEEFCEFMAMTTFLYVLMMIVIR